MWEELGGAALHEVLDRSGTLCQCRLKHYH